MYNVHFHRLFLISSKFILQRETEFKCPPDYDETNVTTFIEVSNNDFRRCCSETIKRDKETCEHCVYLAQDKINPFYWVYATKNLISWGKLENVVK